MITNEVAFIAIAVTDKERARKFYQETLELKPATTGWTAPGLNMNWDQPQSALVVTRRGNLPVMEQPWRSRCPISMM